MRTREEIGQRIATLLDRPVMWSPPERTIGDYDGRERTLDVFNTDAEEQLTLRKRLRPLREEIERVIGGPIVIIFHTKSETARLYEKDLELAAKPIWPRGKPLPRFRSEEEEADWWYAHEFEFEEDESDWVPVNEMPRPGEEKQQRLHFWNLRLSAHKSIEFQVERWPDNKMFDFEFRWRPRQDHAGAELAVTLFWYEFALRFYDHRHWDDERGTFVDGEWYKEGRR